MLKQLVNEARWTLLIETQGPVLVKSGYPTLYGPDMTPVLTYRHGDWQPYLPGSSLKGVVRSHVEKVARTLNAYAVCDPFSSGRSCGRKLQKENDSQRVYQQSCLACRLFGSTAYIGRVSIDDAYLIGNQKPRLEARDGVGIDRLTGGAASGAKFDLEVVPSQVRFRTEVVLRNFECWQLGALLLVMQDLQDGLVRIGSGRSRGLGAVRGWIAEAEQPDDGLPAAYGLEIHYPGRQALPADSELWGLGRFLADGRYGTWRDDALPVPPPPQTERRGIRLVARYTGEALQQLSNAAIAEFVRRVTSWSSPAGGRVS
jgi:CRISPR-associated RAMP protein (TIGR02581 family)